MSLALAIPRRILFVLLLSSSLLISPASGQNDTATNMTDALTNMTMAPTEATGGNSTQSNQTAAPTASSTMSGTSMGTSAGSPAASTMTPSMTDTTIPPAMNDTMPPTMPGSMSGSMPGSMTSMPVPGIVGAMMDMGSPDNQTMGNHSNVFYHDSDMMDGAVDNDIGVPSAFNYSVFQTSGELRVAVDAWLSNETDQVREKYGPIEVWDVSLVDDMKGLFELQPTFNENITAWNTQRVTNMDRLFFGATIFNQPLSKWNTSLVTSMIGTFHDAKAFAGDISTWQTGAVRNMGDMFRGASSFNTDISFWDVTKVRDMSTMFWEATSFNVDLSNWDVSRNRDFSSAFKNATAFDQKLCWIFREEAMVLEMFCASKGGTICDDKICSHDLYYDEKCVRPSTLAETTCDPPSQRPSGAATRYVVVSSIVAFAATLLAAS